MRSQRALTYQLNIVGCANGSAGRQLGCDEAASVIQKSDFLSKSPLNISWECIIQEVPTGRHLAALPGVSKIANVLASTAARTVQEHRELLVLGGDHSCAIGTWSGVASALRDIGDLGLIWIDAHMDSHTPDSSDTGNIHGMPAAHLLGCGAKELLKVGDTTPKIKPSNLVFIGIRSYEPPEKELLERMGVRVFYIDEVEQKGIREVLREAIQIVSRETVGFGFSIDIDGFRVEDAPAVGTPENRGIIATEFLEAIKQQSLLKLVATEIVEFLPRLDDNKRTSERLVVDLINTIYGRKFEELSELPSHKGASVQQG